jgi:hypothetical protein
LVVALKKTVDSLGIGAVKEAAEANVGAVKGRKRAVILEKSGREGSVGPGNPARVVIQSHATFYKERRLSL